MVTMTTKIGAQLRQNGFAVVNDITDAEDIRSIREQMQQMTEQGAVRQDWLRDLGDHGTVQTNFQILEVNHPTRVTPALRQSKFYQRASAISKNILGPSADLLFDHCIMKPAHSAAETAWHQDGAYSRKITLVGRRLHWWLPLQAVSQINGCMEFVAQSHRGRILPHRLRSPEAHAKYTDLPADAKPIACPLPVGSATIHLLKTLHYTGPNMSDEPRYAWVVQFGIRGWIPSIVL